uniref:TIL domain-containing protein n=1 Tax=Steinernema glaseri TaxID=37863 RepID=A0A1I8A875_9BILA
MYVTFQCKFDIRISLHNLSIAACPKNEIWMNCGTCEGTCDKPLQVCTRECKKPGCYCPTGAGFVRNASGDCIHLTECKHETTAGRQRLLHLGKVHKDGNKGHLRSRRSACLRD